jgi:hypothetical protein
MNGAALVLALAVHVRAGSCPAAAEVEAKLAPLLAPGVEVTAADVGVLDEGSDGALAVSLLGGDGRTRFSRQLAPAATCAEQAEIVAVTLAAWESEIHPTVALRLDHLTAPAPVPAPVETVRQAPAPPPQASTPLSVAVGAAGLASFRPDLAAGGRLEASVGAQGRRLRWQLSATAFAEHRQALETGEATWWRLYVTAGPEYAWRLGRRWQIAAAGGPVLGLLTTAGSGFPVDLQDRSLDVGAEARLRLAVRWRRVLPWVEVSALAWIRRQTVAVTGSTDSSLDLPRVDPLVAAGADFFVWP